MMTKMSMKVSDSFPLPTWHDGEVNEPNLILIYDCFLNFDVFGFSLSLLLLLLLLLLSWILNIKMHLKKYLFRLF